VMNTGSIGQLNKKTDPSYGEVIIAVGINATLLQ